MTVSDPQLVKNRYISFSSSIMVVGGCFTGHFKDIRIWYKRYCIFYWWM